MSESTLVHDIRQLSTGPIRLFRNNVGKLQDVRGNYVTYGLAIGSSDLIGWHSVVIRPVDVGCEFAVFCAIEAKSGRGKTTPAQHAFIATVRQAGGLAGVARTIDDARHILGVDRFRR